MATDLRCINRGGDQSVLHLADIPKQEHEVPFAPDAVEALAAWEARPGEVLSARAPDGSTYRVRLTGIADSGCFCVPFSSVPDPELSSRIYLFQALPEKERFELILQKSVELGVAAIIPFVCQRSTSLGQRDSGQKKSHRWPQVVLRAARQCRRRILPELYPVLNWQEALAFAGTSDVGLLCHPMAGAPRLQELLKTALPSSISLLVGPEGGFSAAEVEQATAAGITPVSLGTRLLRTETAAIVALALAASTIEEMGTRDESRSTR